jgi:hypothetical protein
MRALLIGVASEWIPAVAGLAGAAVGASATLATNWIANRTQVKLAVGNRAQQIADVRRAAFAEYLTAVDTFLDQARDLASRMDQRAPSTECEAAHVNYLVGWESLNRACAPTIIAGPAEVAELAEELQSQLGDLGDTCDSWYSAHQNSSVRSRLSVFGSARQSARDARDAFISAARKHAYPEAG